MRPRIAYVTNPDSGSEDHDRELLLAAFDRARMDVQLRDWDQDTDWEQYDALMLASSWGETGRRQEFLRWARSADLQTLLANPVRSLVRSTDRTYLRDLNRDGVPCVPALWFEPGDSRDDLTAQIEATGWESFAVEPNTLTPEVHGTTVGSPAEAIDAAERLLEAGRIVSVRGWPAEHPPPDGVGVVLIGGRISHAFPARNGEFSLEVVEVDDELAQVAQRVAGFEADGEHPVYARVDAVWDGNQWLVRDFDACGPDLHLRDRPASADELARAVRALIIPDERRSASAGA